MDPEAGKKTKPPAALRSRLEHRRYEGRAEADYSNAAPYPPLMQRLSKQTKPILCHRRTETDEVPAHSCWTRPRSNTDGERRQQNHLPVAAPERFLECTERFQVLISWMAHHFPSSLACFFEYDEHGDTLALLCMLFSFTTRWTPILGCVCLVCNFCGCN